MDNWQPKRILILGTTYPSYSQKYTETVCTGGIFEDTFEMVRLHPIPHRYLETEHQFKSFQFIKAKITRNLSDPRPESYRIEPNSIELQEAIPPERPEDRRKYLERSPHFCSSVEELKDRQDKHRTSLGIVVPKKIIDCSIEPRSEHERLEWEEKERTILDQQDLFNMLKPIDFPEAQFFVSWECNDIRCRGHKMNLHQWGIHELYRKLKNDPERDKKVLKAMRSRLDQSNQDVFLFLGNFRGIQFNFGLMDSYSAKKTQQLALEF
ncbi:hypothetical protein HUU39_06480 [candidate division KSB1 bacterium]|nr:hypothetical protein [bacterium]NUM64908.1 hypothetical protein [candidate division KSB1 bacterium]